MTQPGTTSIPVIGAPQAGGGLRLRSFGPGRLVLILPQREQSTTYEPKDGPKPEIVCDILALDGPPITFGGKANNKGGMETPDTMTVAAPWFATSVVIGGASILGSLRKALPDPRVGKDGEGVVGRLYQDPQFRDAWKIADPRPEEIAFAQQMITALFSGQFVNPVPRPIAGPNPGAPQVSYSIPQQAPPPAMPMSGYAAPVAPAAPAWPIPQQAAPVEQPVYAPPVAPQAAWQAPGPQTPPADMPLPGWSPEQWATLNDAQKAQLRAAAGQSVGIAPQSGPAYQY